MAQEIFAVVETTPGDYYSDASESIDAMFASRELAEAYVARRMVDLRAVYQRYSLMDRMPTFDIEPYQFYTELED